MQNNAKQVGKIRDRWSWVEPDVWTDRMLTALEKGVKGDVWFSLIDKVYSMKNLRKAFEKVKKKKGGPGIDNQTIGRFEARLEENLKWIQDNLKKGTYTPQSIKRVWIPKPGSREKRPLGIPTVRDRVVQTALRNVLEPIFEHGFAENSYGFRPNRGAKDALRQVKRLIKDGFTHVVDIDLKSYFDSIPHQELLVMIKEKVADSRVLKLIEAYLKQKVMDTSREWDPISGTPQGAVISPLLSNIYLNPLDHLMEKEGFNMIRYADDFIIHCKSNEDAQQALRLVEDWTVQMGLTLHPVKTRITNIAEGGRFDFLGYEFYKHY